MNTPRTDAIDTFEPFLVSSEKAKKLADLSRQIERELIAEQEKVKELREALKAIYNNLSAVDAEVNRCVDDAYEIFVAIREKTK